MTSGTERHTRTRERLSAVMDGEADEASLQSACAEWREAEGERATWHAWHLIGDVMRSDDLASSADHDASFLSSFRLRLADEPVVLAPAAVVSEDEGVVPAVPNIAGGAIGSSMRARQRRTWTASAAVAAGFVAVAGAVLVLQRPTSVPVQAIAAAAPRQAALVPVSSVSKPVAQEPIALASGQMIRDARLQQYLAAHKQFGGATALGVPSGFLRSATVEMPAR